MGIPELADNSPAQLDGTGPFQTAAKNRRAGDRPQDARERLALRISAKVIFLRAGDLGDEPLMSPM